MEDYNKIIESLSVRHIRSKSIRVDNPVQVDNFYDVSNTLLFLHRGELYYGQDKQVLTAGEILFIPGGRSIPVSYGGLDTVRITNEDLLNSREKYFTSISKSDVENGTAGAAFSYISFEAKVFSSVNFFSSLDIPAFTINSSPALAQVLMTIIQEEWEGKTGKERVIMLETDRLVIELFRYIIEHNMFVEKLATNSTYFKDPRLLDIFAFIKNTLNGDLSNKTLANVANVSEDYVGQYFKMLTGINPQDFIEYQRMEMAVHLLRTSKKSVREIGQEVGYKDTAYFCRRFKMMFGIPAGKMRRRESLMNI
jgi:AraC-like DNA-binding protein